MAEGKIGPSGDESTTGSKYEAFFGDPYAEFNQVIGEVIADSQKIVDLGCHNGRTEEVIDQRAQGCSITCVDIDRGALDQLKQRKLQYTNIEAIQQDANEFLGEFGGNDVDTLVVNATLHEINPPADQEEYLVGFFESANKGLKPGGRIVLGDYYYPDSVSDEEVKAYMAHQMQAIGHADPREKFVTPGLVSQTATEHGFSVQSFKDIRAVKELDRRYYLFVLQKEAQG